MAQQALEKSKDAKEMKKFRGSIKGQITIDVNKLGVLIGKKDGDDVCGRFKPNYHFNICIFI